MSMSAVIQSLLLIVIHDHAIRDRKRLARQNVPALDLVVFKRMVCDHLHLALNDFALAGLPKIMPMEPASMTFFTSQLFLGCAAVRVDAGVSLHPLTLLLLCSDEASMITGVAMEVDGGRCI